MIEMPPALAVPPADAGRTPPWGTIVELVRSAAETFGARDFLRFDDHQPISFALFDERTQAIADTLVEYGVRPGGRVALMMSNGPGWPLCWIGILRAGGIAVPVNSRYQVSDLRHVLTDSGAIGAIVDVAAKPVVDSTVLDCPDVRFVVELGDLECRTGPTVATTAHEPASGEDVANLQYTSGTTGFPKACVLTHDYWLRTGWLAAATAGIRSDDVVLTSQPFSYIDPQWHTMMCLISGVPLVVLPRFSASGFWPAVRRHGATFIYVLGTMPLLLFKQPTSAEDRQHNVRLILCSGIIPRLHGAFEERWGAPWREAYGMTETGIDLAVPEEAEETVGTGAIGKPVATKEVDILHPDGSVCERGQVGELVVRGRPMMREYFNRPEETSATIVDGWLHTGDTAYRDPQGWVHLVGRLKDMIRRAGENIACVEVESVASGHELIEVCAVTAIPDPVLGEDVKIFVKLVKDAETNAETARSIVEFIAQRIAAFKVPRFVEFVDDFPLTPSERVSKPQLLSRKADQRSDAYRVVDGRVEL